MKKKPEKPMASFHVKIDHETRKIIDANAKAKGLSRAAYLRMLIRDTGRI